MPPWLIPILSIAGALLGSLAGSIWRFARLESDVERMKEDIGTHDTGLRGAVHKSASLVTAIEARVTWLERQEDRTHD